MSEKSTVIQKGVFGSDVLVHSSPKPKQNTVNADNQQVKVVNSVPSHEKPSLKDCAQTHNPNRMINYVSDIDEEHLVCIIGVLIKIRSQLRFLQNFKEIKVSPHHASDSFLFDKMYVKLEQCIRQLGRIKS